jgi:hypothetical protein
LRSARWACLISLLTITDLAQQARSADHNVTVPTAAPASDSLPQITVRARRHAIEEQVHRFVNDILYLENDEGPARWSSPVCPTVAGLAREEGEFVLQRLSQVGRTAGVPLADEKCSAPNLFVIASAHPVEVLTRWAKKTHGAIFGGATPTAVRAVIDTSQPVLAWYNADQVDADDGPRAVDLPDGLGTVNAMVGLQAPALRNPRGASHLTRSVRWSLCSVILVIDKTQLNGVTHGQLADYISMHAFARLKTGARPGDVPTILGLFAGAAAESPPGLTTWDAAFLESLYHTDAVVMQQRMLMVTRMVEHIVPDPSSPQ